MTPDMWLVTCDTWHVGGMNILSKFQLPSSYCFWFMILWRYGGKGWLTDWINDEAVHTPGLLTSWTAEKKNEKKEGINGPFLCRWNYQFSIRNINELVKRCIQYQHNKNTCKSFFLLLPATMSCMSSRPGGNQWLWILFCDGVLVVGSGPTTN